MYLLERLKAFISNLIREYIFYGLMNTKFIGSFKMMQIKSFIVVSMFVELFIIITCVANS